MAFGDNPGALRGFEYVPDTVRDVPALVLFLHGCSQDHTAAAASGLIERADDLGFVVLAAEQSVLNNGSLCFNWFNAEDTTRDAGEAESLHQMVDVVAERHATDAVFVVGMSAGAAMGVAMLADYPEVFRAGASMAGGPFGCAHTALDAAGCMAGDTEMSRSDLGDAVRAASDSANREGDAWPGLVIMQGSDDMVVDPKNADLLFQQWLDVHGGAADDTAKEDDGADTKYVVDVEELIFPGLGHALPVQPDGCGEVGPFAVDIGFCAMEFVVGYFSAFADALRE